jgi:hypothetical protein
MRRQRDRASPPSPSSDGRPHSFIRVDVPLNSPTRLSGFADAIASEDRVP